MKRKLTNKFIDSLKWVGKPTFHYDALLSGFGVKINKTSKAFIVERSMNSKTVRTTIGQVGIMSLEDARIEAQSLLAEMAKGIHPRAHKLKAGSSSLRSVYQQYISELTRHGRQRSEKTIQGYERLMDISLKDLAETDIYKITKQDLKRVTNKLLKESSKKEIMRLEKSFKKLKSPTAEQKKEQKEKLKEAENHGRFLTNQVVRLIKSIFNYARREFDRSLENPCDDIILFEPNRRRTKYVEDKILPAWYAELSQTASPVKRDFFLVALLTGLRLTTITTMQWKDVDFDDETIFIPKPKGGTHKNFYLPLTDYLKELLIARKEENDKFFKNCAYVFPAERGDGGHIKEIRNKKMRMSGLYFSPHDMRRTFITQANRLNISAYNIKALINHTLSLNDVTGGYVQISVDDLRQPMQQITNAFVSKLFPSSDKKVTNIHHAAQEA